MTKEVKTTEVNSAAIGYAEQIKKHMATDKEAGTVADIKGEQTAYLATLPDTLTPDIVAAVRQHDTSFVQGSTVAVHEAAMAMMGENKDLSKVKGIFDMHKGSRSTTIVERSREFTPPSRDGSPTEKIVHHGFTTTEIKSGGVSGKAWDDIRHTLAENAKKILG